MSDPKQELIELQKQLPCLKQAYEAAMKAFLAHPQDQAHVTQRRQALQDYHSAAVAYFNAFEHLICLGSQTGADKDATWYTHHAETAANLLETIEIHYRSLAAKGDELRLSRDMFKPSLKAYSNMQRLVSKTDAGCAAHLRAVFVAGGLPVLGFDTEESEKPATRGIEWRYFGVGCFFALIAVGMAVWAFSLEEMKPHQYFILRWLFPLASAFSSGSFTGSIVTSSNKFWWGLAVAATGGFAVWLLANLFLLKA
jgi:hypothetical protein